MWLIWTCCWRTLYERKTKASCAFMAINNTRSKKFFVFIFMLNTFYGFFCGYIQPAYSRRINSIRRTQPKRIIPFCSIPSLLSSVVTVIKYIQPFPHSFYMFSNFFEKYRRKYMHFLMAFSWQLKKSATTPIFSNFYSLHLSGNRCKREGG